MGFFNGLLKGLGFESEKKDIEEKKENPSKETHINIGNGARYDLTKVKQKSTKLLIPHSQVEVQQVVDELKKEPLNVDLSNLEIKDYVRALDFLSGAVYALGGKIVKIKEKVFFLCTID